MKKYLLLLLLPFLFLSNVNADECTNILQYQNWLYYNNSTYYLVNNNNSTYYLNLTSNTDYTLYFDNGSTSFNNIFINGISKLSVHGAVSNTTNTPERFSVSDLSSTYLTFNSGTYKNFNIRLVGTSGLPSSPFINATPHTLWLVEGTQPCNNSSTPSDSPFSDFLVLYLDRISYLANGFNTNPYLLAMVSIIFGFVVLELFLHIIHLKGGYKK